MIDLKAIETVLARWNSLTVAQRQGLSEADTRAALIDPLFAALGWRMDDPGEVRREGTLATGRPDYALLITSWPRAYLEAKRAGESIDRLDHAQQVISYAYNTGVDWAILCNFERLVVFDALELAKGAQPRRLIDLACDDYPTRAEDLELISPTGLAGTALNDRAERTGTRPRRLPPERRLYEQLRDWRERLINELLTLGWRSAAEVRRADEAVQRLFDRLLFMRSCEDRGIGPQRIHEIYNALKSKSRIRLAERLQNVFAEADRTYDSELFAPNSAIDAALGSFGTQLDAALEDVVRGLYEPKNSFARYNFSQISADVLGQVYEQYLGHVAQRVRQEAERQLRLLSDDTDETIEVEAKRRKRKDQGIYYTPRWVVDYIVEQTVGCYLTEHSADSDAVDSVRILDPACGSGSFLIRAYEHLLRHHSATLGLSVDDLDRELRQRILDRNIFGVDLDPQAVEIARLNLLLRMVREPERLPYLRENIKRGNSLVSGTRRELKKCFGDEWSNRYPFDWLREFPLVMANGGFDVLVGNPPYVRLHRMPKTDRAWYFDHYGTARNKCDLYGFFIERGVGLLRESGLLGFIIPDTWCAIDSFTPLRRFILDNCAVLSVTLLENPFAESTVSPVILILKKCSSAEGRQGNETALVKLSPTGVTAKKSVPQARLASGPNLVFQLDWSAEHEDIEKKISSVSVPLADVATMYFGIKTGDDATFVGRSGSHEEDKRVVRGKDVKRYRVDWDGEFVWYVPEEMKKKQVARPGRPERFEVPEKLIMAGRSGRSLVAALDTDGLYALGTTSLVHQSNNSYDLRYLLGLINSKLLNWWYGSKFITSTQSAVELEALPIRRIDDKVSRANAKRLSRLVERMLGLQRDFSLKKELRDEAALDILHEVPRLNQEIDALVYSIYGLTPADQQQVEATTA